MELPTLKLEAEDIKSKITNVLAPLFIDDSTCTKLVAAFENEIEKGILVFTCRYVYSLDTYGAVQIT